MLVSSVIALLAIGSTSVSADNYATYNLLKDDRAAGRLVFIPTTLAQKRSYYPTSRTLSLQLWSAADPFPTVKKLRENIKTITDEELQLGLTDAFVRIRDHHTRWTNMAPYGCFYATTRITPRFKLEMNCLQSMGLSFVEWFKQNQFTSGAGANEFGGQRAALEYLTTIYGKINRLPSEDSITFQFKSRANPRTSILSMSQSTNMGIIKLDSFDPEDVGTKSLAVLKAVMIVRSLLANELKDTKSVMYELRGNSGGDVDFADSMNIFVDNKDPNVNPFAKAWQETKENSRFSSVFFPNSVESVNTLGQAYLRPMGVLNDARCYSSCEVFSGSIQGHDAGTIFGEDERTGGGGATVMKLDPFLIRASPTYFKSSHSARSLPVVLKHTQIHSQLVSPRLFALVAIRVKPLRMWVSRQILFVRPRWSDLQPNPTTNTQYDRIAEQTCSYWSGEWSEESATTKQKFSIPVSAAGSALGNNRITIVGKTAGETADVDSSIEAFFTAPVGTKINIGIDVDSRHRARM
ncbi:hypothetical protein BASA61_002538 [Batrachochytrium salamandrivorans]|nr:hypothetical protein BASA61_002538 [Batrachochytrium salamandrivorans]